MKDKLLQIRVDEDFLSRLEYLRKINGFKTIAETVRKLIEKEYRKEAELPTAQPKSANELAEKVQNAPDEDFISRKAAIEAFDNLEWFHQNANKDMVSGANPKLHQTWYKEQDIYKVLEQLPSAQQRWIPCSERLPDKPDVYMVTDHDGRVVRYVYNDNESSREYWKRCAKAWMPLPEPYRAERRTDEQDSE